MSELRHVFTPGAADAPVLLLLHGTGSSPEDILVLGQELSPESPVIAPAGPVSEQGLARWFRRRAEGVFDFADVRARAEQLAGFVTDALAEHGLTGRRLVAAGFSNGANIAAALTVLHPQVLREAALFAAMQPVPDPPALDLSASRVFLSNGTADPMAPLDSTERFVAQLRERSAEVTTHRHPGGHQVHLDGLAAARTWLAA